jgi:hypothetical protein
MPLTFSNAHKADERLRVKAGQHSSRVYRLVDNETGETIGEVVQPVHGPTIVSIVHSSITDDGGTTFRRLAGYFGEFGAHEDVGEVETDTKRIKILREALNQWKADLENSTTTP